MDRKYRLDSFPLMDVLRPTLVSVLLVLNLIEIKPSALYWNNRWFVFYQAKTRPISKLNVYLNDVSLVSDQLTHIFYLSIPDQFQLTAPGTTSAAQISTGHGRATSGVVTWDLNSVARTLWTPQQPREGEITVMIFINYFWYLGQSFNYF